MKSKKAIVLTGVAALAALLLGVTGVPSGLRAETACEDCDEGYPDRDGVCRPVPTTKTVADHCWRVEWKRVCIPAVQPPWARWWRGSCDGDEGCDDVREGARCGRVRWVRVLVKEKRERKVRTCDWLVEAPCDDCVPASGGTSHAVPVVLEPEFDRLSDVDERPAAVRVDVPTPR